MLVPRVQRRTMTFSTNTKTGDELKMQKLYETTLTSTTTPSQSTSNNSITRSTKMQHKLDVNTAKLPRARGTTSANKTYLGERVFTIERHDLLKKLESLAIANKSSQHIPSASSPTPKATYKNGPHHQPQQARLVAGCRQSSRKRQPNNFLNKHYLINAALNQETDNLDEYRHLIRGK